MPRSVDELGLTPSQRRIYDEVRRDGKRIYNGRARRPIEALEKRGLATVDWDMEARTKGNGIQLCWRITVTPREAS